MNPEEMPYWDRPFARQDTDSRARWVAVAEELAAEAGLEPGREGYTQFLMAAVDTLVEAYKSGERAGQTFTLPR